MVLTCFCVWISTFTFAEGQIQAAKATKSFADVFASVALTLQMKKQMQHAACKVQMWTHDMTILWHAFEDLQHAQRMRNMTCLERLRQLQRQAQQWNFVDGCDHLSRNDSDVGDVDTKIARNREKSQIAKRAKSQRIRMQKKSSDLKLVTVERCRK